MITKTRQPTTTRRTETHCPVCGGLECLCRPRFFAGQLLTEEDLNRLENYVIGKKQAAQPIPAWLGGSVRS
jgi:hypothetical protein